MIRATPHPFDAAAASYDGQFTDRRLGRVLRRRVHAVLEARFAAGHTVLDLGCGTGEDAAWLADRGIDVIGVDASAGMLARARAKLAGERAGQVRFAQLDLGELDPESALERLGLDGPVDGALADFGVVNCLSDPTRVAAALGTLVRPRGTVVLVPMGRLVPVEILGHLAGGAPRAAVRRFGPVRRAHAGGGGRIAVRYPSPAALARQFRPWFRTVSRRGLGVVLPPSDLGGWLDGWPRLLALLDRGDRLLGRLPGAAWVADHYLLELERRSEPGEST